MDVISSDSSLRAVILRSIVPGVFCAGMSILMLYFVIYCC